MHVYGDMVMVHVQVSVCACVGECLCMFMIISHACALYGHGHVHVQYVCNVTNTGPVTGDAVVLGFVNSTDPQFPRQKLFDFTRITLTPGASKTVMLSLNADHLSVVGEDGQVSLRPAKFSVRVGDVIAPATHSFEVSGASQTIYDYSGVF